MFRRVLIANRGEIACRIQRTLARMGIESVAVYSEADRHARHVRQASQAVCVGPPPVAQSYLDVDRIVAACVETGADAVHPGYGFLSENAAFAERLAAAGIRFIGPRPEHMRVFGLKHTAREAASACGVPLLPGTGLLHSVDEAIAAAERIGYPVMIKSSAGGGGIGLQLCRAADDLPALFETVKRLSKSNFKDDAVYLERYVDRARHVEVQIFGDGAGTVVASLLGHRISRRVGPGPCLVLGIAACGTGWLAVSMAPVSAWGVAMFALMLICYSFGAVLLFINFLALRQAVTPGALLGRMTSTMRWLILLPAGPGALIGGWLGEHFGLRASLAFAGGAALVLAAFAWRHPVIRDVRTLPRPEAVHDALGAEAAVRPMTGAS